MLHENKPFFSLEKISSLLLLVTCLFLVPSCTVQKKKNEKDGPIKRLYHNTTAHFNGYFNAEVLLNESILALSNQHQDNYTKTLPVFDYVAADNPQAVAGNLDDAIKKVTVVVSLHPESNWSDDAYLLAAKAQYVKKDYESAEETLLYMLKEFSPEAIAQRERAGIKRGGDSNKKKKSTAKDRKRTQKEKKKAAKKKKKEREKKRKAAKKALEKKRKEREKRRKKGIKETGKETETKIASKETLDPNEIPKTLDKPEALPEKPRDDPENYFLKHRPAFQEGQLWMARTFIERNEMSDAARLIELLDKSPTTFKDVKRDLAPVKAHYHLKQRNNDLAIEALQESIELGNKRKDKARYSYILAQLYQQKGDNAASKMAFEKALKYSNDYDMEFSARLNIIRSAWESGTNSGAVATRDLEKMIKDIKNEEYRDQIYYLLAQISLKDNDQLAAIGYLKSSLEFTEGNKAQQAESYLQLAQLYFDTESFVNAKSYYDSTLQVLPKTDERYDVVTEYANNLTGIAKNLVIIETQDSLLRISKMSPEDQKALAFKLKKEADQQQLTALTSKPAPVTKGGSRNRPNNKSNYWAYNDKAKKKGFKDFQKRWGERPLEDNWRRSNRSSLRDFDDIEIVTSDVIDRELTDDDVKRILSDVPTTPADIVKAETAIQEAMFKLGTLYSERLQDNDKSIKTLEDLDQRFPNNSHQADVWYYLYLAHTDKGNTGKAKIYYDKLVAQHPNSTYARILTDPDFLAKNMAENKILMDYYDKTYTNFEEGKYQEAYQRIQSAEKEFGPGNMLQAKFALLAAMCNGNLQGKEAYINALKTVVAKYPNTPEEVRAKEILKLLGQSVASSGKKDKDGKEDAKGDSGKYKAEPNKLHYFIVVIKGGDISLTDAKVAISDYNREFHKLLKLRISPVTLGDNPMVVIRRFKSQDKAMAYYDSITKNTESFLPEGIDYEIYPITQGNYRTILKSKSLDGYKAFFEGNYF